MVFLSPRKFYTVCPEKNAVSSSKTSIYATNIKRVYAFTILNDDDS